LRQWQDALPVPLFHHWHEDRGFRPNPVRNEAVANTDSDIIIMLDGDMIMHPQFVADHIHFSREGQFIQSRRVRLSEPLTTTALRARQYRFSFFTPGVTRRTQAIRNRGLSGMVSTRSRSMQHIRGANMSMWRKDFVAVNGMNEDFIGWGFEDHDLTARLYQLGLDRLYLRHAALAYHLEHDDNNRDRKSINQEIFEQNCRDRVVRVSNGLVENHHLKVAAAERHPDY